MYIVAIIPARSGSKGLKNKNIIDLAGYPLIAYSIAAAKLSHGIDRIIVSTDSAEIAQIAQRFGAEVPFLRPIEISSDLSKDSEFMFHALNWLNNNENRIPDLWVHLRPTTPLREPSIIDNAIDEFLKDNNATSLRSAHIAPESPFKWFVKNTKGYFANLSKDISMENANNPRQIFPDVYVPDGYVDIVTTEFMQKENRMHGDNTFAFLSPYCIEIDTKEELEYLKYQLCTTDTSLLSYLNETYQGEKNGRFGV